MYDMSCVRELEGWLAECRNVVTRAEMVDEFRRRN